MASSTLLIELHYLPSVAYFTLMSKHDHIWLEAQGNFLKQTYRNRCYILTSNKIDRLTVPVKKKGDRVLYKDVEVDYSEKWENRHWRAIQSAYAKAPFFEYYADGLAEIIYGKHRFLFDLNKKLLTYCLKLLGLSVKITETDRYIGEYGWALTDARSVLKPTDDTGIIHAVQYHQLFTKSFVEGLSIIDLLFNEGTYASKILENQRLLI